MANCLATGFTYPDELAFHALSATVFSEETLIELVAQLEYLWETRYRKRKLPTSH